MPGSAPLYHERLPVWPKFSFPNTETDGLLPTCRVNDWEHFIDIMKILSKDQAGEEQEMVYRGQRLHHWELSSTLAREYDGGSIPETDREALLRYFKRAMLGRGPELRDVDEDEIWAYGQHHGLFTPLLDWSRSPFIALYFAFAEADDDDKAKNNDKGNNKDNDNDSTRRNGSRVVFFLNMSALSEIMPNLFLEPSLNINARLVHQSGLFTITPAGSDNLVSYIIEELTKHAVVDFDLFEDAPAVEEEMLHLGDEKATHMSQYLCKIHIPNTKTGRDSCLAMLRKMNIHPGSLFPDTFGAVNYAKDWLRQKIARRRPRPR